MKLIIIKTLYQKQSGETIDDFNQSKWIEFLTI